MPHHRSRVILLTLGCLISGALQPAAADPAEHAENAGAFAKTNLHVWAYEEYDAIPRTPAERAQLLNDLGITKAGYICRNAERSAEFEAYVKAYRSAGIDLVAAWTPVHTDQPLDEPQIRKFLDIVDRHKLRLQWWLTLEEDFDSMPAENRVNHAVAQLQPLVQEAIKRNCRLVLYGHGSKRWFTQCENEIAIVERLQTIMPKAPLGIVYNFHQSRDQMDRLPSVFPKLMPHLVALNLNGMLSEGPRIVTLGEGDHEREMIRTVMESGWKGRVGIIDHRPQVDARMSLQANLDGLQAILREMGNVSTASTY